MSINKSTDNGKSVGDRAKLALTFARRRSKSADSWIDLHNALYGMGGKCTELFSTQADRTAFAGTREYQEIARLLDALPDAESATDNNRNSAKAAETANGRILVRVPRSVHAALLSEAEAEGVSLNQLIVAKLTVQLRAAV
jgi:hypothetical protein